MYVHVHALSSVFLRLYAVGGRDGSSCLRSVECFDPHTNRSEAIVGWVGWGVHLARINHLLLVYFLSAVTIREAPLFLRLFIPRSKDPINPLRMLDHSQAASVYKVLF